MVQTLADTDTLGSHHSLEPVQRVPGSSVAHKENLEVESGVEGRMKKLLR